MSNQKYQKTFASPKSPLSKRIFTSSHRWADTVDSNKSFSNIPGRDSKNYQHGNGTNDCESLLELLKKKKAILDNLLASVKEKQEHSETGDRSQQELKKFKEDQKAEQSINDALFQKIKFEKEQFKEHITYLEKLLKSSDKKLEMIESDISAKISHTHAREFVEYHGKKDVQIRRETISSSSRAPIKRQLLDDSEEQHSKKVAKMSKSYR